MSQARNLSGFLAKVLASGDLTDSGVDAVKLGGKDSSYYLDYNNLTNTPAIGTDSAAVSSIITADVDAAFINALTIDADTLGGQNSAYYLNYNNLGNQPSILDSANISSIITSDVNATFINALTIDADTLGGNAGSYYLDYTNFTNTPTLPTLGADFVDSTEARELISVTDLGGDGSLTYTAGTGILTYTGPSAAEVRAHFSAGTGVTISTGQVSIGQSVGTTDNVTFNDMVVSGDLTVNGTTTTVNSNTVHIGDNIISLNHDETGTPSQDAGIEIERGTSTNKTLVWNETTDKWTVGSETFVAGMFEGSVAATTLTADSATLGAVEGFSHLKSPHSATTKVFTVTVASKTVAHRYNGTGSGNGYVIDGVEAPFLTLTPGRTYRFDQADATNSGHPLRFYYDVAKNDSYSTNVTTAGTPGSAGAYTEITIADDTPLVLHYQCSAHANMGSSVQTNARNFTGFTSDDLTEGTSSLYFTNARVTTLVDSAYVQARTTAGTDSAATIALITSTVDSAYVALREADAGGGGGSALTIQEEGVSLATAATTLNFTGSAVTASGSGATKTINITGGGGVNVAASYVEDYTTTIYTATAGLTTFNASSSPALPAYTAGKIGVFVNGVKRTDFTATDGTSVVMTNALALNDHVEIINFGGPLRSAQDPLTETKFTATAGQTTFALNYTAGHITVFLNGAKLSADDYTATNGTSVVLTTGAALNDVVEVIEHGVAFATPYSATNYTKGVSGNVSGNTVSSLNYTPGKEAVYLNGIKLLSGDDYTTVDSGSSITFINNIVDSDRIEVVDHGIVTEATLGLDSAAAINLIDSDYVVARAGAGGGSLEAIASGVLANGDKVVVNSDGTVSVVSETTPTESIGSPTIFESAEIYQFASTYDVNANRIVICYADGGNSYHGTAVVGEVSGTSITFGTPVVFNANGTGYTCITYDANAQKVVIGYQAGVRLTAIVGTVSSNSISFGTASELTGSSAYDINVVYDANAQKVLFTYQDVNNNNYGGAVVGTVTGTSISLGTPVVFQSSFIYLPRLAYDENAQKIVVFYRDVGNNNNCTAKVGTISGTSITFGSAATTINYNYENAIVYAANVQKMVVIYRDANNSGKGTYRIGTVSGTSITFSSPVVFYNGNGKNYSAAYDADAEKITISFFDASNLNAGTLINGSVGASSITFGTATVFDTDFAVGPWVSYDSFNKKMVIAYENNDNNQYGTAIVFQNAGGSVTNLTSTNYIGISDSAYSNGATATIQIVGSVDDAQSGLTAGKSYYVQTDGTLSTTPDSPSVFAGTAVSSTKIIVKG